MIAALCLYATISAYLAWHVLRAPLGHQDACGFHLGAEPRPSIHLTHQGQGKRQSLGAWGGFNSHEGDMSRG